LLANKLRQNQARRQKERAAGKPPTAAAVRKMLVEQDWLCSYCAVPIEDGYHIDHKLPIAAGGTNDPENLHLTCARCNLRKGAMTHEQFLVSKRRPARQWAK
jgi:5-methylcytosine-specific restriction endonuclease McrA